MDRLPHYFDAWFDGLAIMGLNEHKYNLPCNEGRIYLTTEQKRSEGIKRNWKHRKMNIR